MDFDFRTSIGNAHPPAAGAWGLREGVRTADPSLLTRLVRMRRLAGAANFALLAATGGAGRLSGRFDLVVDDDGAREVDGLGSLCEAGSVRILTAHLEQSSKPVVWSARGQGCNIAPEARHFTAELTMPGIPVPGIAFPVRLGAIGNGYVALSGAGVAIDAPTLLALHRQAYRVVTQLMKREIEKQVPRHVLTERELACLQKAGDGCRSEEIAERLGLSVHTVNAYLGTATAKLDSVNRVQAIAKALRLGLIA